MADYGSIKERWTRVVSPDHSDSIGTAENSSETATRNALRADAEVPPHASATPSVRSASNGTFIGNGALFEGTLTLRGDFRIDTEFRGELETDGTITVETSGSVVGSIRAREIVIRGAVVGNVSAPRQIILESTGKLHGDIETACLEIQKHSVFQGSTSMSQPQTMRRPSVVPSEDDASPTAAAYTQA